jgi:hypothetical protein
MYRWHCGVARLASGARTGGGGAPAVFASVLGVCLAFHDAAAAHDGARELDVAGIADWLDLTPILAVLRAPDGRLAFADLAAKPSASRFVAHAGDGELAFRVTQIAVWLRWEVQNNADHERRWVLEVAEPTLDYVDLYRVSAGKTEQIAQIGDARPFGARPIAHGTLAVERHAATHGKDTYCLRARTSTSLRLPLRASSVRGDFAHHERAALAHFVLVSSLGRGATFTVRLPRGAHSRAVTQFSSRDAAAAECAVGG